MRRGLSLAELLVTMAIMGIIMALVVPMMLRVRTAVRTDQVRTSLNQDLRAATGFIGTDIRIAGERFPAGSVLDLSPIEIVPGDGGPDEIILRRNLMGSTLPICEQVLQGSNQTIRVVRNTGWLNSPQGQNHPECGQPVGSDGWPQNLSEVRALADSIGVEGVLQGYIIEPSTGNAEFIRFRVLDNADLTGAITRTTSTTLQHSYDLVNRPLIFILDQRHYRLEGDVLELTLNGDVDATLRATAGVVDLRFRYVLADSVTNVLPPNTTWRDIVAVEATITGRTERGGEVTERTLNTRFFPRNILSR